MPAFLLLPPALSCCFRSWLNILSDLHVIVNWFSWGFQCSFSRTPRVSQPLHTFRRLVSSPTRIRHLGLAGVPFFLGYFFFCILFSFLSRIRIRSFCQRFLVRKHTRTRTRSRSVGWLRVAYRFLHLRLRLRLLLRLFLHGLDSKHNVGTLISVY